MATERETSSPEKPTFTPTDSFNHCSSETLEQPATPWIDYAIEQARVYQKNTEETLSSALEASRSRLSVIRATGSAHLSQTIVTTLEVSEDVKSYYAEYEDILFAKIKEGVSVAASHPMITCGVAAVLGLVFLKGPRRFLYYKSLRLFLSARRGILFRLVNVSFSPEPVGIIRNIWAVVFEKELLQKADAKARELRHSIDVLKAQSKKFDDMASNAEETLVWGRKNLRQAGKQIQTSIGTGYKIERQARGLKDIIGELPRREASLFRDEVKKLTNEAKKERVALSKEVTKISNYGISV